MKKHISRNEDCLTLYVIELLALYISRIAYEDT